MKSTSGQLASVPPPPPPPAPPPPPPPPGGSCPMVALHAARRDRVKSWLARRIMDGSWLRRHYSKGRAYGRPQSTREDPRPWLVETADPGVRTLTRITRLGVQFLAH